MNKMTTSIKKSALTALLGALSCNISAAHNDGGDHNHSINAPAPYGATPSKRQMAWHEMEMYAFMHFTINTFTDREWGYGDESPTLFNPTDFKADQIVGTISKAGFKGLILTCKHHDGFCLWPTKTTKHNISASPYKKGKGDIVKEVSDSCAKHNIKFAPYVSPWDRNNEHYGTKKYVTDVFRPQVKELITNYGDIFEVWFDGANGGDGYYGGARTKRSIDRTSYYGWDVTNKMIRKLAPNAVIFSDVGPDLRWIGNEHGHAGDPCWATYTPRGRDGSDKFAPGMSDYHNAPRGTRNGKYWIPGECDVSIRPGWFYHKSQDGRVRTPENLMNLYFKSVGRGASLLLNFAPDRRGQLPDTDVKNITAFGNHLRNTFRDNLALGAKLKASNTRNNSKKLYGAQHLIDNDKWSAWVTDNAQHTPSVELTLTEAKTFDIMSLREDIRLGQRVGGVSVDAWLNGKWQEIAKAQSIGARRLWKIKAVTTDRVRLRVTNSPVCPALSDFGLFKEAELQDYVSLGTAHLSRKGWKITSTSSAPDSDLNKLIDGKAKTLWHTYSPDNKFDVPQSITIDLGAKKEFAGIAVLPRQDGNFNGMIDRYRVEVSNDGKSWKKLKEDEFSNIKNNPIEQEVYFDKSVKAQFMRFTALRVIAHKHVSIAEINLIPASKK